jgi:hypothetical protein
MHASSTRGTSSVSALRGAGMLVLLALILTGCLSTSLIEHWKDPSFAGPPLHKVLVVGVQRDAGQRRVWESSMVAALARQHIAGTPSYEIFPDRAPTADQLAQTATTRGFDGVMATHFVDAHQRNYWAPGYAGVGFGWRWRYFGYWDAAYGPGWVNTDYIADFQTDVFTVAAGGQLIWTGVTRSVDLSSIEATTDQISRVLVPELSHAGVVASS